METDTDLETGKGRVPRLGIVIVVVGALICVLVLIDGPPEPRRSSFERLCSHNLHQLGLLLKMYSDEGGRQYPTAERWNDLLKEYVLAKGETWNDERFVCPKVESREGCSYALNPNVEPNSPRNTVLMFESWDGWNQYGGAELLCFDNHQGQWCNVLLNDYSVKRVKPEEIGQLRWE